MTKRNPPPLARKLYDLILRLAWRTAIGFVVFVAVVAVVIIISVRGD